MSNLIDISLPLNADLPAWPGSGGFSLERIGKLEAGDPANVSYLKCEVHFGTHIDVPLHFLAGGTTVDQIALDALIGPAVVAYLPDCTMISVEHLQSLNLPPDTARLLLRTDNSLLWGKDDKNFYFDYVALSEDAASWITERGIKLLGIDYLSVQPFNSEPEVHRILLDSGVVLLEGLNLNKVLPGNYELIALPLNLVGAEGAPVRAVLRPLQNGDSHEA